MRLLASSSPPPGQCVPSKEEIAPKFWQNSILRQDCHWWSEELNTYVWVLTQIYLKGDYNEMLDKYIWLL